MSVIDLGSGAQPVRSLNGEWHSDLGMFGIVISAGRRRRREVEILLTPADADRLFQQLYPYAKLPPPPENPERERVVIIKATKQP